LSSSVGAQLGYARYLFASAVATSSADLRCRINGSPVAAWAMVSAGTVFTAKAIANPPLIGNTMAAATAKVVDNLLLIVIVSSRPSVTHTFIRYRFVMG